MTAAPSDAFAPRWRRITYLASPLSQLMLLGILAWHALVVPAPSALVVVAFLVGATALCAVSDVLLMRALLNAERDGFAKERVRLLEEQMALQERYFERLSVELKEARESRQLVMSQLSEAERLFAENRVDEACACLSVSMELTDLPAGHFCQNHVINALLDMKARTCEDAGIVFDVEVSLAPMESISDVDLCAAFSNLLDNAIKGATLVTNDERFVRLRACTVSGMLVIDVENACVPEADVPHESDDSAQQRIVREHGWGLLILESLAVRYHGSFKAGRTSEDVRYRSTLMLSTMEGSADT